MGKPIMPKSTHLYLFAEKNLKVDKKKFLKSIFDSKFQNEKVKVRFWRSISSFSILAFQIYKYFFLFQEILSRTAVTPLFTLLSKYSKKY